ncbi:MAG: GNAT family N-acetyltransferase [Candidatus Nomurabacteria bacterium]|nr:MAG: GNAT family N-acetyltransferase [Candidatus Nomurabacteria bacterium]
MEIDRIYPDDEDFKQVLKLRYELLDEPVGAPEITEPSDNDRNPDNVHMVLYGEERRIVTAVRLDKSGDAEYVVRRMVVATEQQRRGLGGYAMGILEGIVGVMGGQRVRLNSTPEAIPFYHALGYEDTGEGVEWAGAYHPEMIKDIIS